MDSNSRKIIIRTAERIRDSERHTSRGNHRLGLCKDCKWFRRIYTRYGREICSCVEMEVRFDEIDPVEECSYYKNAFSLSLDEMMSMAIIIDPSNKIKPGFINEDEHFWIDPNL